MTDVERAGLQGLLDQLVSVKDALVRLAINSDGARAADLADLGLVVYQLSGRNYVDRDQLEALATRRDDERQLHREYNLSEHDVCRLLHQHFMKVRQLDSQLQPVIVVGRRRYRSDVVLTYMNGLATVPVVPTSKRNAPKQTIKINDSKARLADKVDAIKSAAMGRVVAATRQARRERGDS